MYRHCIVKLRRIAEEQLLSYRKNKHHLTEIRKNSEAIRQTAQRRSMLYPDEADAESRSSLALVKEKQELRQYLEYTLWRTAADNDAWQTATLQSLQLQKLLEETLAMTVKE